MALFELVWSHLIYSFLRKYAKDSKNNDGLFDNDNYSKPQEKGRISIKYQILNNYDLLVILLQ